MADAELLLSWRNDPDTRANSHQSAEVALSDHLRWLSATLANPCRHLYVAELAGEPVGTVRADWSAEGAELSWTVAPSSRGRGLGTLMVLEAVKGIDGPIRAEVKSGNVASERIALAAGMVREKEVDGVVYLRR